jgi:hypothetical protein
MIHPEHDQAQSLASQAALLKDAGDAERAASIYRAAAEHERVALAAVPSEQPRTLGILAVSLAALQFKGGDVDGSGETCRQYLRHPDLAPSFRTQLEEILRAVRAADTPTVVS